MLHAQAIFCLMAATEKGGNAMNQFELVGSACRRRRLPHGRRSTFDPTAAAPYADLMRGASKPSTSGQ
jgi:hypothetical protein